MSFLNQLKSQASALQQRKEQTHAAQEQHLQACEAACRHALQYLEDAARQLNVIAPAGPRLTLDGKTPWPAMKLVNFRVDARRKQLDSREVFDYVAAGWQIVPQSGAPVGGVVSVNFPPDLERVESRLAVGMVKHERKEQRHPEKNTLQAIRFEYLTETRGNITITPDHHAGTLGFRLVNLSGFGVVNLSLPADRVKTDQLDELAKLIVGEPSRFV